MTEIPEFSDFELEPLLSNNNDRTKNLKTTEFDVFEPLTNNNDRTENLENKNQQDIKKENLENKKQDVIISIKNDFDEFYADLSNNWKDNNYVIEKIISLNLNECDFLPYQKKFLEGILLQKQGKYEDAFKCFLESNKLEENGYVMNNMANCYHHGEGVKKNFIEAVRLYKLAIEKGSVSAICNLGYCYENEIGVDKNPVEAVRLYKLAVEKGNITAHYNLGYFYQRGVGVDKNIDIAIKLYKVYFEKSDDKDFTNLIKCYNDLSFNQKYEFYKSLSKNSPILEKIQNIDNTILFFEIREIREEIKNLQNDIKLIKLNSFF